MRESSLPFLTFEVEATPAGAERAAQRLSAFAADHRVAPTVGRIVGPVAGDVVRILAGALGDAVPAHVQVEADIAEHDLQVVIACAGDDARPARMPALRRRLVEVGRRCDGFGVERAGVAGVQVWCCFRLRDA